MRDTGLESLIDVLVHGQDIEVARMAEAEVEAEWTRHLGKQATAGLRRTLNRLREITDPFR